MTYGWAGQEVTTTRCPPHPEDHSTQPRLPAPSDILPWVGLHCCPGNPCMVDPVVGGVGGCPVAATARPILWSHLPLRRKQKSLRGALGGPTRPNAPSPGRKQASRLTRPRNDSRFSGTLGASPSPYLDCSLYPTDSPSRVCRGGCGTPASSQQAWAVLCFRKLVGASLVPPTDPPFWHHLGK